MLYLEWLDRCQLLANQGCIEGIWVVVGGLDWRSSLPHIWIFIDMIVIPCVPAVIEVDVVGVLQLADLPEHCKDQ